MDSKECSCCFFGHRKIPKTEELKIQLYAAIERLILQERVHIFLFGSKSEFDDLCYQIVTELKEKYMFVTRIYVRAEFPQINDGYKNYLLQHFEETYYPDKLNNAGRASYVERNYEMIDRSTFCICYYDAGYVPPKRKKSSKNLTNYQPKSGTKIAYQYAMQKKRTIINMADTLH